MIDKFVTFCGLSFAIKDEGSAKELPLDYLGFLVLCLRFPQNLRIFFGLNKIVVYILEMPVPRRDGPTVTGGFVAGDLPIYAALY